jgi:2-C-methyl-D-erythritol 4-phosphate cytidylyltransferase
MGKPVPKQFLRLFGKPIMIYALEILEKLETIDSIYITYNPEFRRLYEDTLNAYNLSKCELVPGGSSRQESVLNGLKRVKTNRVLIHEAARPMITVEFVQKLLKYEEKAVVPTVPIPFTVSQGGDYMEAELDRSKLHNIQLPQVFDVQTLLKAHELAQKEKYLATEDGLLVFRLGEKVRFVPGLENNIKITTSFDLILAENIFIGNQQW